MIFRGVLFGCAPAWYASHVDPAGVLKDGGRSESAKWNRKAAEQGDADAANNLAVCCERGLGVPQDLEQAVHWYRKAAEKGHESGREALDRMLSKLEGAEH